jgi:NAD(P)-dependent dehydrogenase (short-subunit alcohol dehydrogenase family)
MDAEEWQGDSHSSRCIKPSELRRLFSEVEKATGHLDIVVANTAEIASVVRWRVVDDDRRSVGSEALGDCSANAARISCYQRILPFECRRHKSTC